MDDYSLLSLSDSKNEWCARLINLLTPAIIEGLRSIFIEARNLCCENDEEDKYLMTFQTFLSRVPKWNDNIIEAERKRIEDSTNCGYLEDLITCVHIIQLKALTCVRVGTSQKKVDIDIPSSNEFIHRVYINAARKLYMVVYLFERDIAALQTQKNNRELELIVKECILNSVRDTMPIETILKAYMEETEEENVTEEIVPVEEEEEEEEDTSASEAARAGTSASEAARAGTSASETARADTSASETARADTSASETARAGTSASVSETTRADTSASETARAGTSASETARAGTSVSETSTSASETARADTRASETARAGTGTSEAAARPGSAAVQAQAPMQAKQILAQDNVQFTDTDKAVDTKGMESNIIAPKTDERLERIAAIAAERRKAEEEDDEDQITIGDEVKLEISEVNDLNKPAVVIPSIATDIEVLS